MYKVQLQNILRYLAHSNQIPKREASKIIHCMAAVLHYMVFSVFADWLVKMPHQILCLISLRTCFDLFSAASSLHLSEASHHLWPTLVSYILYVIGLEEQRRRESCVPVPVAKFLFKESAWTYRKSNGTTVARQQGRGTVGGAVQQEGGLGGRRGCSQGSASEPPRVSPWWFGIRMLRSETWATEKEKWTSGECCSQRN